jgi:hypothetical protein
MSARHNPRRKNHSNVRDHNGTRTVEIFTMEMVDLDRVGDHCIDRGGIFCQINQIQTMTPDEFKQNIDKAVRAASSNQTSFLLLGAKLLEGEMKQRIFNDGIGANGSKIGKYKSKSWITKRSENGRQTNTVDLEFTGDLRNSIKPVKSGRDVFLVVVNDRDFAKAKGQEDRRKKEIFTPTSSERESVEKYITDLFMEDFTKFI